MIQTVESQQMPKIVVATYRTVLPEISKVREEKREYVVVSS
jgi:hypothetical protein